MKLSCVTCLCWLILASAAFSVTNVTTSSQKSDEDKTALPPKPTVAEICRLVEYHAFANRVPRTFFARLIWKESRFDVKAVSPVGAQGIAQFMPGTAKIRGLKNAFDYRQALPASAHFLIDLKEQFGNWGLAAAAYNAGGGRVDRWLRNGGNLPLETQNYVLDITGEPVEAFADRNKKLIFRPLVSKQPDLEFQQACAKLPIIRTRSLRVSGSGSGAALKPWGVQLAGHFKRNIVARKWTLMKRRHPRLLSKYSPTIRRQRSANGRRGIYSLRIGANSQREASSICNRIRRAGLSCVVARNR